MFLSLLNDACPWFDGCEVTQRKKTETEWHTSKYQSKYQNTASVPRAAMEVKCPCTAVAGMTCFSELRKG